MLLLVAYHLLKITQAAQDEIEIAKVLVRDDAEKEITSCYRDYNFVTNVDDIEDKEILARCGIDGPYRASYTLSPVLLKRVA